MATTEQAAANRRNAARSTGPRTKSGKARSSRNALRHGLSAEQVVMLGEDPAAFDALRADLFERYQPTDPVAEHLVEHVVACIWRLRRVPEIEAGVFEHHYLRRRESRALLSKIGTDLAKKEEDEAKDQGDEARPVLGEVFEKAERPLNSLIRIAGAIEGSMYRAIRELERMRAERQGPLNEASVIDVEADEEDQREPSGRRLSES